MAKATESTLKTLERVPRNSPAQWALNGQKVVLRTGEALLGPGSCGSGSDPYL